MISGFIGILILGLTGYGLVCMTDHIISGKHKNNRNNRNFLGLNTA